METKTVYRLFAEWSFDKEEEWLNSMAQEGWTLKRWASANMYLSARSRANT